MPSIRKLLLSIATFALFISCSPNSDTNVATSASSHDSIEQARMVEGHDTLADYLNEGLSSEQRTKRDAFVEKSTDKTLKNLHLTMTETEVQLSDKNLQDLEALITEANIVNWSIEHVYRKRAFKHGERQIELGQARLKEIRDKVDVILEPINIVKEKESVEKMKFFMEQKRREKEVIERGETVDYPQPEPFKRKTLSPDEKTKMRAKRLDEITILMEESSMTLSESDIEHYLGFGERSHDRLQSLAEGQYYQKYRGARKAADLPSHKKANASALPMLQDSHKLTLITKPLEIARLDKLKDQILKENAVHFTKQFEEARYVFTENDVARMSKISWELDRIQHERRLKLAEHREAGGQGVGDDVSRLDQRKNVLKKEKSDMLRRLYLGN